MKIQTYQIHMAFGPIASWFSVKLDFSYLCPSFMNSLLQWAKFIDQWPWSINTKEGLESLIIRQFLWFWCSPQIQNFHWPWGKNSSVLSNRGLSKTQQNKESECRSQTTLSRGFWNPPGPRRRGEGQVSMLLTLPTFGAVHKRRHQFFEIFDPLPLRHFY